MAVAEPWPPGPGRAAGIALALLQTLPLAVRRWRPVGVLAVVAAAALVTAIARDGGGLSPVCVLVALYSVAAHCPRRQAAWAGIAAEAALTWPLLREGGGPGGPQQIGLAAAISLGFPALGGCPAPTSVSCGAGPRAAAASRNWRPGGRSPRSRPGSAASCTTSSPTPSA